MAEHVEGDWNGFNFRMIQTADIPSVLLHLRENFYRDEPLCKNVGFDEDMAEDIDKSMTFFLNSSELNFLVTDKSNGKIAGVRINAVVKREDKMVLPPLKSKKTLAVLGMLMKVTVDAKIFEKYPEIDHYVRFVCVSVDKEYRGHGLATEIYERAIKLLRAKGFPLIKCEFTSPYTQRIARKREFILMKEMRFVDWKDENGEKYFPNAGEDEVAMCMVKELKDADV